MMKNGKDFFEYRKNKRIAKRETAKLMANSLPSINKFMSNFPDIIDYVSRMIDGSKMITTDQLWDYTISDIAQAFSVSENRVSKMVEYILSLDGAQITRLVSGAAAMTSPEWQDNNKNSNDNDEDNSDDADGSDE